jgi:threonine dehydratase
LTHLLITRTFLPPEEIFAAQSRIEGIAVRTPLVRMEIDSAPAEIYLKLENLQPVGSFKLRGAANALAQLEGRARRRGVWTASAGNMGFALAWCSRRVGIACAVIVPDDAPAAKLEAIDAQGAQVHAVPFAVYQEIQRQRAWQGLADLPEDSPLGGRMVHPFADPEIMAGNATIGMEIAADLPDAAAVVVPYGGGGLSCGIAGALRATHPQINIYAAEVETAAPLAASLAAGRPVSVSYTASFVSGMGAPFVFSEMWSLASRLLDGSLVVSLAQVRQVLRLLAWNQHIIAEGAGGVAVAAALAGMAGSGKVVCIVSGGNIDRQVLINILQENIN